MVELSLLLVAGVSVLKLVRISILHFRVAILLFTKYRIALPLDEEVAEEAIVFLDDF